MKIGGYRGIGNGEQMTPSGLERVVRCVLESAWARGTSARSEATARTRRRFISSFRIFKHTAGMRGLKTWERGVIISANGNGG